MQPVTFVDFIIHTHDVFDVFTRYGTYINTIRQGRLDPFNSVYELSCGMDGKFFLFTNDVIIPVDLNIGFPDMHSQIPGKSTVIRIRIGVGELLHALECSRIKIMAICYGACPHPSSRNSYQFY